MEDRKTRRVAFILAILLIAAIPVTAEAASRGVYYRPAVTFVVHNAPSDMILRVDLQRNGETVPAYLFMENRFWETYYRLYRQTVPEITSWHGNRADFKDAVLVAMTGGKEIQIPLSEETLQKMSMNDYFMLDASDFSLRFGLPLGRAVALFFLRLAVTLAAALLILYLCQYRWLRSWIVVLVINLICQGGLSLFLVNKVNFHPGTLIVQILIILAVLIIQIPLFWWLLDENGSYESISYAAWSNLATGVLNVIILINFPL